ncbi:MAG: hypothetical protein WDN28_14860 [Chthoniobacter sp.]
MSHPDDRFFLLSTGYVARHTLWRTEAGVQAFMSITADFAKGSSGCPVLDERGTVIGIVNNTESIYYDDDGHRKQLDLQMVVKNATPSWAVLSMIEGAPKTASGSPTPRARAVKAGVMRHLLSLLVFLGGAALALPASAANPFFRPWTTNPLPPNSAAPNGATRSAPRTSRSAPELSLLASPRRHGDRSSRSASKTSPRAPSPSAQSAPSTTLPPMTRSCC